MCYYVLKIKHLPMIVFFMVLALSSGAGFLVNQQILGNERLLIEEISANHATALERYLSRLRAATHLLSHEVREYGGVPLHFTEYARDLITYLGGISNLQLAPDGVVRKVYPEEGHKPAIGHDILRDERRRPEALAAVVSKNYVLAGPFELVQGGRAVIGRQPVFLQQGDEEKFWGFASALVYMDELLDASGLLELQDKGYHFVLYRQLLPNQSQEIIEQSNHHSPTPDDSLSVGISLHDSNWQLVIERDLSGVRGFYVYWLFASLALAFLAFAFIRYISREPQRLSDLVDETNSRLDDQNILLNAVLDNINEGIVVFDRDKNLSLANRAARRLHNQAFFAADSKQWRHQSNLYAEDGVTPLSAKQTPAYRVLSGEQVQNMDLCVELDSGKRAVIKATGKALKDSQGNDLGAIISMHDVTDLIDQQRFIEHQNRILNMVMHGDDIDSILTSLIREIEMVNPGIYLQLQLLDNQNEELSVTSEISSSAVFRDIDLSLGRVTESTPWGRAILHRQSVIVDDLSDPLSRETYPGFAERTRANACCSQPVLGEHGHVVGVFTMFFYRSEEITAEELALLDKTAMLASLALERHEKSETLKKMSLAIEYSPSLVMITDVTGVIEYVNPKLEEVTGYQYHEIVGNRPDIFSTSGTPKEVYKALWDTLLSGNEWCGDLCNRKKNGELFWSRQRIAPICLKPDQISHFVSVQEDVTEAIRISREVTYHATHDMLTGLLNRREFERRLQRVVETAAVDNTSHALCILDLDAFKVVNDTCGHLAGDELLRQLSSQLEAHLRKRDSLARLGGDEFGILMEHCSPTQAHRASTEILNLIESYRFQWEDNMMGVSASIGVVEINQDTQSVMDLMKQADQACYAAKDAGRNQMVFYREDDELLLSRRGEMHWISEINEALEGNRFTLYAQKMIPLNDKFLSVCYEILLRLRSKEGKLVFPGAFLPAAERYNLAPRIDRWVIENTFAWIAKHKEEIKQRYHFSINLSGLSISQSGLLDFILECQNKWELPANLIKFEITETAAISNLREASAFIRRLRQSGFHFALDDFGSGLSSFAYLKNLPVDYLKIDGMFVRGIMDDPIDEAMVRSINEIGHVMGISTIAEFVESESILQRVSELGVDYAQGYSIQKPVPLDQILGDH